MRVRLIHVTPRRAGTKARREEVRDDDRLTVGRGTDNDVQIPGLAVPLHHSAFFARRDGIYVEAVDAKDLRVNGKATTARKLSPGDVVRIGRHELRVVEPARGENLALEIEQVEVDASELESLRARTVIGIERGWLSRRSLSWGAVLAIVAAFLAAPLLRRDASQRAWSVGPLAHSHSHLEDDCRSCHAVPFQRVRDEECLACHAAVTRHTPVEVALPEIHDLRCASCHREHESGGSLAFDATLCTTCHASLAAVMPGTGLLDVSGFTSGHPEFRPSVVVDPALSTRERISLDAAPQERSGIRFTHVKHLRPDLRGRGGRKVTLQCASCHTPDSSGALMEPVSFGAHCQGCHALAFEEGRPEREAPHAAPGVVREAVFDFYAGLALRGDAWEAAPAATRWRPGRRPLTKEEEKEARAWASQRADEADRYLLSAEGVCAVCHALGHDPKGSVAVVPVRIAGGARAVRWLPFARFDHRPHRMIDCGSCHATDHADTAGVVLLPGIATCRPCHGDRGGIGTVQSDCILCHHFHNPNRALICARAEGSS